MRHGFQLTEEVKSAGFSGGSIKVTDAGHLFDLGKAFTEEREEGERAINQDKIIVTDDDILANILSTHPALETVAPAEVPDDVEVVESPRASYTIATVTMPPQYQTNDVPVGAPFPGVDQAALLREIPAEHADEPATPEQAVAAGEAVSGSTGSGSNEQTAVTDYEMPKDEQPSPTE